LGHTVHRTLKSGSASLIGLALLSLMSGCTASDQTAPSTMPPEIAEYVRNNQENIASCMNARGWGDVHTIQGYQGAWGLEYSWPEDDEIQAVADLNDCTNTYGHSLLEFLSEEQAGEYANAIIGSAACLRRLGIMIPDAPSKESIVTAILSGSEIWNPDAYILGAMDAASTAEQPFPELGEIDSTCPAPAIWAFLNPSDFR